jgi:hypothetical protein
MDIQKGRTTLPSIVRDQLVLRPVPMTAHQRCLRNSVNAHCPVAALGRLHPVLHRYRVLTSPSTSAAESRRDHAKAALQGLFAPIAWYKNVAAREARSRLKIYNPPIRARQGTSQDKRQDNGTAGLVWDDLTEQEHRRPRKTSALPFAQARFSSASAPEAASRTTLLMLVRLWILIPVPAICLIDQRDDQGDQAHIRSTLSCPIRCVSSPTA